VAPQAAARKEALKERTPRVDWAELLRRTFDVDVFACVRCGGRCRVLAYVKEAGGVHAILEHLGLPTAGASLAPARGPPEQYARPVERLRSLHRVVHVGPCHAPIGARQGPGSLGWLWRLEP